MQPTAEPGLSLLIRDIDIQPGLVLPIPDDAVAIATRERLSSIDLGVNAPTVTALGMLAEAVVFIASIQGSPYPRPLLSTRVVMVSGTHAGGVVAGPTPDPRHGTPLAHLAVAAGAGVVTLEWQPAAAAIEVDDAITSEQMDVALRAGWAEAERAADEGIEILVLAASGAGGAAAAAAIIAAVTGAEPAALLPRVATPAGIYDDSAWMTRCLAIRDALHRVRDRDGDPRTVLAALGGCDLAAATGLILGAAYRRTPVMIDGPVGAAAALLANDISTNARRWVVLPDHGRHPAVYVAAESLELRPWLDLCLDIGEGASSLAALPMLQTALTLAGMGESVDASQLTRYDSTGNQIFVGKAKPVEPTEPEPAKVNGKAPKGVDDSTGGKPAGKIVPTKAIPTKAVPTKAPTKSPAKSGTKGGAARPGGAAAAAKTAGAKAAGGSTSTGSAGSASGSTSAESTSAGSTPTSSTSAGATGASSTAAAKPATAVRTETPPKAAKSVAKQSRAGSAADASGADASGANASGADASGAEPVSEAAAAQGTPT